MNWKILDPDPEIVSKNMQEFHCTEIIAKTMANRGIISLNDSHTFFNPDLNQLHDPFLMKDMEQAVDRIILNIDKHIPILIFGDYDVDGTTAASVLYLALNSLGAVVSTYIPNRDIEGHGLSIQGIEHAQASGSDLIITCDCGINAFEQVNISNSLGIDVIVTDHHIPGDVLPDAFAVLNPQRTDCTYPFDSLCGSGVAFKLAYALMKKSGKELAPLLNLLDIVTLGTAADFVPILDENRIIVHYGIEQLSSTTHLGIQSLLEQVGLTTDSLSVGQLVFNVTPKINAAGRMGDGNRAVELLTTQDSGRASELAEELVCENKKRRKIQDTVLDDAIRKVNSEVDIKNDKAIILADREWHSGVIGIVASKLKEEYNRPIIIISIGKDGIGKGSARSIENFDMYNALTNTSRFLEGYGGHPMAAGFTVKKENLNNFRKTFLNYSKERLTKAELVQTIVLEGEIHLKDINSRFMTFLNKLEPYGPGNMRPKFVIRNVIIAGNPKVIGNGDHLKFKVRQGKTVYGAIGFNMSQHYEKLIKGCPLDIACLVEINEWRGQESIQLNVRDIKLSGKSYD